MLASPTAQAFHAVLSGLKARSTLDAAVFFCWALFGTVWPRIFCKYLSCCSWKRKRKSTATKSEEVVRKHREYIWPAVANFYEHPLVADRARMQYVWDLEGRKYLDFFGGILTISVGHTNPKVTSKIKAQVDRLQHISTLYPTEPMVDLAEKIAQIAPGKLQKSFFSNSGTEANEAALLLARMATGSFDIIGLRHGYSGASALARSVTGQSTVARRRRDQRWRGPCDQSLLLPLPAGP